MPRDAGDSGRPRDSGYDSGIPPRDGGPMPMWPPSPTLTGPEIEFRDFMSPEGRFCPGVPSCGGSLEGDWNLETICFDTRDFYYQGDFPPSALCDQIYFGDSTYGTVFSGSSSFSGGTLTRRANYIAQAEIIFPPECVLSETRCTTVIPSRLASVLHATTADCSYIPASRDEDLCNCRVGWTVGSGTEGGAEAEEIFDYTISAGTGTVDLRSAGDTTTHRYCIDSGSRIFGITETGGTASRSPGIFVYGP